MSPRLLGSREGTERRVMISFRLTRRRDYPVSVRVAYWRQYVWFYLWKWTMPVEWLHVRTIVPVNQARQDYLEKWRACHPRDAA